MLGLKVEVNPDVKIDDSTLTIEEVNQLLKSLSITHKRIRADIYSHFLSTKHLYRELMFVGLIFVFYLLSEDVFYLYFMPISVLISMVGRIIGAEVLTNKTRSIMKEKIDHYTKLRQKLLSEAN